MKRLILLGLGIVLAGCHASPDATAVETNAQLLQDSLERQADNLEAMADEAADRNAADAMQNVAHDLKSMSDNVAETADATKHDLKRRGP